MDTYSVALDLQKTPEETKEKRNNSPTTQLQCASLNGFW